MDPMVLPGVLASIEEAARFVERLSRGAGLAEPDRGRLRLAVEELMTNVVLHGYGDGGRPPGSVELRGKVLVDVFHIHNVQTARA